MMQYKQTAQCTILDNLTSRKQAWTQDSIFLDQDWDSELQDQDQDQEPELQDKDTEQDLEKYISK